MSVHASLFCPIQQCMHAHVRMCVHTFPLCPTAEHICVCLFCPMAQPGCTHTQPSFVLYLSVCVCSCVNIPLSSHRVGGGVCTYIPLLPSLSGQSIHLGGWRFKVLVPLTQMGFELGHFYFPVQHFNHQTVCQVWCQLGTFGSISLSLEV